MLDSGLPHRNAYLELAREPGYEELHTWSRAFEQRCEDGGLFAKLYGARWVRDPFLQWSRRWEYVYALQRLQQWWSEHPRSCEVLDAGSGFTFFPFYLRELNPLARVVCLDADATAGRAISDATRIVGAGPEFRREDLELLSLPDGEVDVVYSISVIEHTGHPIRVIEEIHRVLKPGGLFVCTFDVSLDPGSPMAVARVERLVERLADLFEPEHGSQDGAIGEALEEDRVVTTGWISETAPHRLPWRYPRLVWLYDAVRGRGRKRLHRPLSFYCGSWIARS